MINQLQTYDYYPFACPSVVPLSVARRRGLTFNSYQRPSGKKNDWKFQGQEHDDLTGWDMFKWRNHQPDIGRFFNVDPLADNYVYNSPYAFSENQVTAHIELEGLEKVIAIYFQGGPTGGGKTTAAAKAGTTGAIYNSTKKFTQNSGREFKGTVIAPGVTSASGVENGKSFAMENYSEGDQVIIYGYSYGVDNAVDLATALGAEGISVNTLVTVDGSDGPLQNSTVNTTISDNVATNLNVYQTDDNGTSSISYSTNASSSNSSNGSSNSDSGTSNSMGSNGGPNTASNPANTTVINRNVTAPGTTHGNIQQKNQKLIQNQINTNIQTYPRNQ